jgi:membrane protein YdbS with pleckstrin-like domain
MESGFMTQNRYIVELYHPNPEKIIPLYITKSSKTVRSKWKEYAKKFKLPALINSDDGLEKIELKHLNKSLSERVKLGLEKDEYDTYEKLPPAITFVRKNDKMVLKVRKIVWDVYNFIAWFTIFIISIASIFVWANIDAFTSSLSSTLYILSFIAVIIVIISIQILFRKEKLVIKKHKIVNTHKYMLFSTKHNEMLKKDIEVIEVTENPLTGRFYVSIISDNDTITFGAKMTVKDLQWIKKFLIHEIIR